MNEEWKEIFDQEMEREAEEIMKEVNSDPTLKDVQAPPDLYDKIWKQIEEYERQKIYDQLSEEDRECLLIGKAHFRRRRINRYVVLIAALMSVLLFGTVSVGNKRTLFHFVSRLLEVGEKSFVDSDDAEPTLYVDEEEIYAEVERIYRFTPVKLGYLPEGTGFYEATFNKGLQSVNMIYETTQNKSLIYIIRPNFRDGSMGSDIDDKKIQEYQMIVKNVEVLITEYISEESNENQWSVYFEYNDVTYMIRVSDIEQEEVEKIVTNLKIMQE